MDEDREKAALEAKLERCRLLAEEFRDSPTAQMIRELEDELRQQIRALEG
jgi:hypothetical protein